MKKTFSLFPTALGLFWAAFSSGVLASPTVIAGVAKNGTNGNKPLAGATVLLVRPNEKGAKTTVAVTQTDDAGRFAFPSRDYGESDLLMANISHQGFDYWSVAYDGGSKLKKVGISVNSQKVDVLVFDGTTAPVPLDFQVHHLAIASSKTGLKIIERIVVENPTKRTLLGVGPRKISVLLDIPRSAKNVRLDPKIEGKLIDTPNGWGFIRPITPLEYGVRNAIIVSYEVDWPSSLPWAKNVDLSHKVVYPTKFFFVARTTDDKDLQVTAPKLSPDAEAPVPIDGQTQMRLVNSIGAPMMPAGGAPLALPAGQSIAVQIAKPVNSLFWGFAAMTVALCLFLPLAMLKPRGKANQGQTSAKFSEPPYTGLVSEQTSNNGAMWPALNGFGTDLALTPISRDLIQKIADLDDLREAGKIEESEYVARRALWKKELIESLGNPPQH